MTPTKLLIGQVLIVFAVIGGTMWAATQWAAQMLGYQAALGPAWFSFGGMPVYLPHRLFQWWYAYEAYAPEVFFKAGSLAGGGGFFGIMAAVAGSLWRARQSAQVTTYGSSRWANASEVRRAGLLTGRGAYLGKQGNNPLTHDGPEHVMVFAPTRSGKGVGLVIPTLLTWPHSVIVHDIKGENWQLTAGWRATFSHCLLFNPTDPASARYNPLLEVRKGRNEVRDAQNIADILVDPEGSQERRSHWEKTSHSLLVAVILHVLYAEEEKTLAKVADFLSDPSRSFERSLVVMMTTDHLGDGGEPKVHPVIAHAAREVLNKSVNERSGVLSTAMSFLGLYRDPTVAQVTAASDWRIADLLHAKHPVSLYLVVPPSDISRTKPLVRLLLNQIGRRLAEDLITGKPAPVTRGTGWLGLFAGQAAVLRARQLLMMLDEFPALGRLDFFETALAFMAGYGIRSFLIAQSLNQIDAAYGESNAILDNCHVRVAFASNDERTAKRISDSLGTATELRAQKNYAGHRLAPWLSHVMVSRQETARPLLTQSEVMQLPEDEEVVMIAGTPPIKAHKLRYYQEAHFAARVIDPPKLDDGIYADRPALRADDWTGTMRVPHRDLLAQVVMPDDGLASDDDGDLKRYSDLPAYDEAPAADGRVDDLALPDEDLDNPPVQKITDRVQQIPAAIRAHELGRAGDDELAI